MNEQERIASIVASGDAGQLAQLAEGIALARDISPEDLFAALQKAPVRRWIREMVLERLAADRAAEIAERLLEWPEDFEPSKRDGSTHRVVDHLSDDTLQRHLLFLAESNAAAALWSRVARAEGTAVSEIARSRFQNMSTRARETTLHLLVLDPYGPQYLTHEEQNRLLVQALDDPDEEIRGLAAEVIAADVPSVLLQRNNWAPGDSSERVRMAYWRAALVHQPEAAVEAAGTLALDVDQPVHARRTALLALGEHISTRTISPVLQLLLQGSDQTLAEDAAQLMWRHHRTPDIANAAASSEFESVRTLADRLLHPERGSPAAGGSRPGDPTTTTDIFEQLLPEDDRET